MSDADDQMGGHGGQTGKDPADVQTNHDDEPATSRPDGGTEKQDDPEEGGVEPTVHRTGEAQAATNREDDPPA